MRVAVCVHFDAGVRLLPQRLIRFCHSLLDPTTHKQPPVFHCVRITAATTTTTWGKTTTRVQHGELHYFCENLLNMPNTQRCMQSGKSSQVGSA